MLALRCRTNAPIRGRGQATGIYIAGPLWAALIVALMLCPFGYAEDAVTPWLDVFAMREVATENASGICAGAIGALPGFTVRPDAPGTRLVRVSLPFAPGALPENLWVLARCGDIEIQPDLRPLTRHPGRPVSVRRAIVTFPFTFASDAPHFFSLTLTENPLPPPHAVEMDNEFMNVSFAGMAVHIVADHVRIDTDAGLSWAASLIAPARTNTTPGRVEIVEHGAHYLWARLLTPDPQWPRIIEVRADSLGTVVVQAHIQRMLPGDDTAPDLGWVITGPAMDAYEIHAFASGEAATLRGADHPVAVSFPDAHYKLRGDVSVVDAPEGAVITYMRSRAEENVPFQSAAWRRAAFAVGPAPALNPLFEPLLDIDVAAETFDKAYNSGLPPALGMWPEIEDALHFGWNSLERSILNGDDFGNLTSYIPSMDSASTSGMSRLEYCPSLFTGFYRNGEKGLRDAALLWCSNFFDHNIWWGNADLLEGWRKRPRHSQLGGAKHPHSDDSPEFVTFKWRAPGSVDFCTKGFESFLYAYEETGDPRMSAALHWQTEYARRHIHASGESQEVRNVGVATDFLRLYRLTGVSIYREEALRLFRQLRDVLSDGDLFSQSGAPFHPDPPFINDDAVGSEYPFPKPYILTYALQGLPDLLSFYPDEPKLRDVVRAVADFLARSQDPIGGWRYPHPRSAIVSCQSGKTAAMLARAATALEKRGEPVNNIVDAIERVLANDVQTHAKTGMFIANLQGWEWSAGAAQAPDDIYALYEKPEDRDPSRDYTEGAIADNIVFPDGAAHIEEALLYYLQHRPAEQLFAATPELSQVLERLEDRRIMLTLDADGSLRASRADHPDIGVVLQMPKSGNLTGGASVHTAEWRHDEASGATWRHGEDETGVQTTCCIPRFDYIECFHTVWPKPDTAPPATLEMALLAQPSDALTMSDVEQIQLERFDPPLAAAVHPEGDWTIAVASEHALPLDSVESVGTALHARGQVPLRQHGPTTVRTVVYLFNDGLDALEVRHTRQQTRWEQTPAVPHRMAAYYDDYGVRDRMPRFSDKRVEAMRFPMAWREAGLPFNQWREAARRLQRQHFLTPPERASFNPRVLEVEDRGSYEARKLAFNINADCRILAYLLVPRGDGPFPAVLALHDHGAHFSIGKEKVVRPFNVPESVMEDAEQWASTYYGGRYIGDELAKRGYVVFATDVTYWGDRGRMEGVAFEEQQSLAANMIQLGYSWSGYNAWDDIRSAEFLAGLPEVAPERVAAMGLSMGAYRAWQVSAATDVIKAGAAICWMGDLESFMVPDQNQTTGQSAFSMIHSGLLHYLDYPDVASIACPKPMLFFAGKEDTLFPMDGVERSFEKMRDVWRSQDVEDRLLCKTYEVPHLFNVEMQEETFQWLDSYFKGH